jgi:hypothetical protein
MDSEEADFENCKADGSTALYVLEKGCVTPTCELLDGLVFRK